MADAVLIGPGGSHHWPGGAFTPRQKDVLDDFSWAVEICMDGQVTVSSRMPLRSTHGVRIAAAGSDPFLTVDNPRKSLSLYLDHSVFIKSVKR